jgi:acetolactate synthase-1/2/3 large subunit
MSVSEYVIQRICQEGVGHVFMVSGGGGMFLIEALGRHPQLKFVCNHHEQACAMAAEGYSRMTGNLGVALVTTGPAGTNAITGVLCAWTDSVPMLVISGQAKSTMLIGSSGLRQRGFHEADVTSIVKPITKYSVTVTDPQTVPYHLEKAIFLAKSGRPGPVWVDIPVDVQNAALNLESCPRFAPDIHDDDSGGHVDANAIAAIIQTIKDSKRPVIIAGHGVSLANRREKLVEIAELLAAPVVTSRNGFDIIHQAHPLHAGFIGNYGQRAANFIVQNADLVLALGSRLAVTMVGYEPRLFARAAKKIVVDVDPVQLEHCFIKPDLAVRADLAVFLDRFAEAIAAQGREFVKKQNKQVTEWGAKVAHWKQLFPSVLPRMRDQSGTVNAYHFYEVLSEEMSAEDVLVWDQGAAYHCAAVAFKLKPGQRAFSNDGTTPMGYGLPAAIGACFAKVGGSVVCVHGEGGLQMNVQELQTVWHHKLPVKLFVFENKGYTSIKHTQSQFFDGHLVGSDPESGLSCPDTGLIAAGYKLPFMRIPDHGTMRETIREALRHKGPLVVEVVLDPMQPIEPRSKAERLPDGRIVSKPLEDMFPYMDRETLSREMLVPPPTE